MTTSTSIRLLYLGRNKKLPQQIDKALRHEFSNDDVIGDSMIMQFFCVTSQKRACDEIRIAPPHAVFVEVDVGRYDRSRFCRFLRHRLPKAKVIAVCKDEEECEGQKFSFDGYIRRPFGIEQAREIFAKISDGNQGMYLHKGDLHLDVTMRTIDGPMGKHHLPPKLCKLLQMLMERAGSTVSREELMQQVWNTEFLGDTRTLDVHIRWLREKIEPNPSSPNQLITVRGQGYRLDIVNPAIL
jgi:DNA-binding response OmpR family regulator